MKFYLGFFVSVILYTLAIGQSKTNGERIAELNATGIKKEAGRVIAYFPMDSLSENKLKGILDTLNIEIKHAEKLMNAPRDWQVFANQPITYYFSNGQFVANASEEGFVILPLKRVKSGETPFLHETMHVLLRTKAGNWNRVPQDVAVSKMPMWLTEGLPEYIAQKIAYTHHLPKFDVHKGGGYLKIDSTCREMMKTEAGAKAMQFVGNRGVLIELFGDKRVTYAPPFYNCSCSFTKYLGEKYGLETLLSGISAFQQEHETIGKATGKSVDVLKQDWLNEIINKK